MTTAAEELNAALAPVLARAGFGRPQLHDEGEVASTIFCSSLQAIRELHPGIRDGRDGAPVHPRDCYDLTIVVTDDDLTDAYVDGGDLDEILDTLSLTAEAAAVRRAIGRPAREAADPLIGALRAFLKPDQ